MLVIIALIILGLVAAGVYSRTPKPAKLTDKDTLVLADFVNFTGEAVVDGSLDTALSISLQQSPSTSKPKPNTRSYDDGLHTTL